jgi:hypothetical protein
MGAESGIEKTLREKVTELKGLALKLNSLSLNGLPDRLVLLPGKRIYFVETKSPGKPLRPLQVVAKRILEALGFKVYKIDNKEQVQDIINMWKAGVD